jgi:5'-phosphate synthase pdxT subunit
LVAAIGPSVEVLARVDRAGESTIVAVRTARLLATAFHPELTGDHRIHQLFLDMVQDAKA